MVYHANSIGMCVRHSQQQSNHNNDHRSRPMVMLLLCCTLSTRCTYHAFGIYILPSILCFVVGWSGLVRECITARPSRAFWRIRLLLCSFSNSLCPRPRRDLCFMLREMYGGDCTARKASTHFYGRIVPSLGWWCYRVAASRKAVYYTAQSECVWFVGGVACRVCNDDCSCGGKILAIIISSSISEIVCFFGRLMQDFNNLFY